MWLGMMRNTSGGQNLVTESWARLREGLKIKEIESNIVQDVATPKKSILQRRRGEHAERLKPPWNGQSCNSIADYNQASK
jgi:hypothetical protein